MASAMYGSSSTINTRIRRMLRAEAFRRDIQNRIRAGHTARPSLAGMNHATPARPDVRRAPTLVLIGLVVVIAATIGTIGHRSVSSSATSGADARPRDHRGPLGAADGLIPDGASVFDDVPAVTELDPGLLEALRRAATDAADDGVEFRVNSGWRSPAYQQQLLREAVAEYGSASEAARWVGTADTSAHVSGDAVDIGPFDAAAWLSGRGAHYGLCQIYRNESWHYELRPEAVSRGCPRMYADPTHDPRMQR